MTFLRPWASSAKTSGAVRMMLGTTRRYVAELVADQAEGSTTRPRCRAADGRDRRSHTATPRITVNVVSQAKNAALIGPRNSKPSQRVP